ncbi:hypothetical protein FRC09_010101 [Ceratobasidium sp. 395]|nr:hypothetical protein FRC09_010101 [Ceratobasidium sp. 395]
MSSPNRDKKFNPLPALSNMLTPTALPPPFGIESLHDWTSQTGSTRAGSPPPTLKSHRVHPYQRHGNGATSHRSFSAPNPRPTAHTRPSQSRSQDYTSSWIGSLQGGHNLPNAEIDSTTSNHGGSDDGNGVISLSDYEDDESRPPCRYIDTMASESKGKHKAPERSTKPNERESYEDYVKRRDSEARKDANRSEHSTGSTSTQALQNMVLQLKKQSDERIDAIMQQIEHANPPPNEEGPWVGPTQGHTWICPRDDGNEVKACWTFSAHGIGHMDPNSHSVGHIHFAYSSSAGASSSSKNGGVSFTYWVCIRKKTKTGANANEKSWVVYEPGQSHPIHPAYILKKRMGITPPLWILV